jgi:hypothetical protein
MSEQAWPWWTTPPAVPSRHSSSLLVECTVCHVAGVIEAEAREVGPLAASWAALDCLFTPGCIGHVWPEALN